MRHTILMHVLLLAWLCSGAQVLRQRQVKLMGSPWSITLVGADTAFTEAMIDTVIAEVTRIENLLSDWKTTTEIGRVNANAGKMPVRVSAEVFALTVGAIRWSQLTQGAFDVSFAAMDRIWKFDGTMAAMPTSEAVQQARAKVGYQKILLDTVASTIFLPEAGMKIGFGALGEGYAADRCRALMLAKGIKSGIVNGSGDMAVWGHHPAGKPWTIGIAHPKKADDLFAVVPLLHPAVVTSGSYEKYVVFNKKRYAHIINPATGYPATGLTSVTVFGPMAEQANALSTSIMVLGRKKGMVLLKKFADYQCLMMADNGRVYKSPNLSRKQLKAWRKAAR